MSSGDGFASSRRKITKPLGCLTETLTGYLISTSSQCVLYISPFYFKLCRSKAKCILRCSEFWDVVEHMLVVTDISGQHIVPIFKVCLTLVNGTNMLS
jgi:hypothetical protein